MWKTLTARTEQDLCAQLNELGVTEAQILNRGVGLMAIYRDPGPAEAKTRKSKNSKEGDI